MRTAKFASQGFWCVINQFRSNSWPCSVVVCACKSTCIWVHAFVYCVWRVHACVCTSAHVSGSECDICWCLQMRNYLNNRQHWLHWRFADSRAGKKVEILFLLIMTSPSVPWLHSCLWMEVLLGSQQDLILSHEFSPVAEFLLGLMDRSQKSTEIWFTPHCSVTSLSGTWSGDIFIVTSSRICFLTACSMRHAHPCTRISFVEPQTKPLFSGASPREGQSWGVWLGKGSSSTIIL